MKTTCKREDGVLYAIERFVKGRWIFTGTVSCIREVLDDILLVSYSSPSCNRVTKYKRVKDAR